MLRLLIDGPGTALAPFAPRRTGKTEFLSFDLAPAVDGLGHRVVGAAARQTLAAFLDGKIPTASRVQTAMKTLERRHIVDRWDGRRVVADPAFAVWTREQDVS